MGPRRPHDESADKERTSARIASESIASSSFVDRRDARTVDNVLRTLRPWLRRFFEPHVRGLKNLPDGAALIVANHNAGVLMPDVFILGDAILHQRGAVHLPYALVHDVLLGFPPLRTLMEKLGAVRAHASGADSVFSAGKKVLVFPGGDLESMRAYRDRHRIVFGPRRGYIRLAIRQGVPVAPVVTAGAHEAFMVIDDGARIASLLHLPQWLRVNVCPTVLSFPWGLTFGFPPPFIPVPTRIVMEFLKPIHFKRSGDEAAADAAYVEACHVEVVAAMQSALTRIAATDDVGVRARIRRRWAFAEPIGAWAERTADRITSWTTQLAPA